jgi:hypothetical protein
MIFELHWQVQHNLAFSLVEIIFPKKFSALSPEGSQFKKKLVYFFRQQIYLTTKA